MSSARRAAGLGAGVCLALAMPPFGWWPLGLATFALLGAALDGATAREALAAWWIAGASSFALTGPWLVDTVARFGGVHPALGVAALLVGAAWMGSALGLAGFFAAKATPALGAPLAALVSTWASLRYGPRVFPFPLALPLVDAPWVAQCADLVGVDGLGAVLVALSLRAARDLRRRALRELALTAALGAALVGYGALRGAGVRAARGLSPTLDVALVQPVVDASLRWDPRAAASIHATIEGLTREGADGAALTVWHEAAFPHELPFEAGFDGQGGVTVMSAWPSALLFGAMARDPRGRRFNAAFLRRGDGSFATPVAKRRLLPFGEYLPGVVAWPSLHAAATAGAGVTPGASPQRISLQHNEIGVLNCFEDTLPEAGAELAGVALVVNLTNDAWFGGANNDQHVVAARWRAIELRRDLVRASNHGRSAHIDATGGVVALAAQGQRAVLRVTPRLVRGVQSVAPRVIVWGPRASLAALVVAWWIAARRRGAESP